MAPLLPCGSHCGPPWGSKPSRIQPPPQSLPPTASATASQRLLFDSLSRKQRRNQELLASLAFALRSFTNLNRFLELVPLVAARLMEAEGALLLPFQANGQLWRDHFQGTPSQRSRDVLRQLAGLNDANLLASAGEAGLVAHLDQLVAQHGGEGAVVGTSVVARSRQRGRLYVFGPAGGAGCSDGRRHERLDRQLSTGAEIQAQLLPDHCPVIEGVELAARCRPAYLVGGDYYDFIPTRPQLQGRCREQGPWALVMGDVMGKGVPAGLLMTLLRGMLRAEVRTGLPPDRILHDLNQLAQEDLAHSHRFVTLFYSDFDPASRLLRYANAAHNPPLVWRRQGQQVERLDAPGLLIGLEKEADYGCEQTVLEPGDVLLCYTDGVTEAAGISGERFEEQRLLGCLQEACRAGLGAQAILDQLFARLDRFVGSDRSLEDDASLVVLKVKEHPKLASLPS